MYIGNINDVSLLDKNNIILIGEYTLPTGPFAEDYFLIVIIRSGRLLKFSVKTTEIIERLEEIVGFKMVLKLCNVTSASSGVLYPKEIEGRPLFNFAENLNGFRRMWNLIINFGMDNLCYNFTQEVQDYICSHKNN